MTPHSPHVAIDRLTLLWRYSPEVMKTILDKATASIHVDGNWYYLPSHTTGATARLTMMLPDQEGQLSPESADLRFWLNTPGAQQGCVRVEWNPAKAGPDATCYILQELGAFLPATVTEIPATAYVTRLDLAVDVPGITCGQLLALRISHHKRTEVFVGANGEVNSVRIGARGSSARTGTFLRVYDQHLPANAGAAGVRAEIEVSRPGYLAAVEQIKNPFGKFGMYQFSPEVNRSLFACFVSAARERGVKRAMALISNDQQRATEFLAILDQSHASWWDPDPLWERAKQSTAGIFINHAADKGLSLTGLAA